MTPHRGLIVALVLLACVGAGPRGTTSVRLSPAKRAQLYHRWALEAMVEPSVEARLRAVRHIRDAIALEPNDAEHWMVLGKLRVLGEFDAESRDCFRHALVLDPRHLGAYLELAAAWKREWARTLDTLAFRRALEVLDTATALRPTASEPWLRLVPLRYEARDYAGAARAASRALAGRPRRPEITLAAAYVAFHEGEIERADSLFRAAIPRLATGLVPFFDPSTMLGGLGPPKGWKGLDPDPTTVENEIELEYWSRVAHAFMLYYDPDRPGTDARFQTYVQYGAPPRTDQNPLNTPLYFRTFASNTAPRVGSSSTVGGNPGKPPVDFPTPIQVWNYPDLGMNVVMQDRSLHGRFEPRATMEFDPGSRPDPRVLAGRTDLLSLGGGVAVFSRLPPRERRIETKALVARFGGSRRPRLIAHVEVPGGPSDSLLARWVVADAEGKALVRGEQGLSVAACDPAERRATQFSADMPPGAYEVAISVRGAGGRRGLFSTRAALEPDSPGLGLSDLVLTCGDPSLLIGGASARFDANVDARFTGSAPVAGYLEIYRLVPGPDGLSHFEYTCEVRRSGTKDRAVLVSTSRDESHLGPVRRQFVRVSATSLRPGRYQLEVRVRDQISGAIAARTADFVRE